MEFSFDRSKLAGWMKMHGWSKAASGDMGEMWVLGGNLETQIAVPYSFEHDPLAIESTIARLAYWTQADAAELTKRIFMWNVDIAEFRAVVETTTEFGVAAAPLEVVNDLVSGTNRIVRAAAQASHKPKAYFSNLSSLASVRYEKVKAGFTGEGSYKLPLYVPLGKPVIDDALAIPLPDEMRIMTSTMAKALQAINDVVIRPMTLKLDDESVRELVYQGVSKELVGGISELLSTGQANAAADFEWAPSHNETEGAASLPRNIEFPHDSRDALDRTAECLLKQKDSKESFVGKVLGVQKDLVDSTILNLSMAVPSNRERTNPKAEMRNKIQLTLTGGSETLRHVFDWIELGTVIEFRGYVNRSRSIREIKEPDYINALGEQDALDYGN